jgi:hypothetical protein
MEHIKRHYYENHRTQSERAPRARPQPGDAERRGADAPEATPVSCYCAGAGSAGARAGTVRAAPLAIPDASVGGFGGSDGRSRTPGLGSSVRHPVEAVQAWLQAAGIGEGLLSGHPPGRQGEAAGPCVAASTSRGLGHSEKER